MNEEYEIFISSKSEDYILAEEVYAFLVKHGYTVFLASKELQRIGSSDYSTAVDNALDKCHHLIVVSSSIDYINSKWVQYEWTLFSNDIKSGYKEGNLITILSDGINLSTLPASLRHQQSFRVKNYQNYILGFLPHKNISSYQITSNAESQEDDLIGTILYGEKNIYRVIELVGVGNTAKVYKCYSINTDVEFAIKKFSINDLYGYNSFDFNGSNYIFDHICNHNLTDEWVRRFNNTSKMMMNLHHSNLAGVVDLVKDLYGNSYCVMEFVKGYNLRDYIMHTPLSEVDAIKIIKDICAALKCMHSAGILHMDVKPENIIYNPDTKKATLVDYTSIINVVSKFHDRKIWITERYVPFDISCAGALDQDKLSDSIDTYSVVATLFTLLTDELPPNDVNPLVFNDSLMYLLSKVQTPRPILTFIQKGMAIDPTERFHDIHQLLDKVDEMENLTSLSIIPKYKPLNKSEIARRIRKSPTTLPLTLTLSPTILL